MKFSVADIEPEEEQSQASQASSPALPPPPAPDASTPPPAAPSARKGRLPFSMEDIEPSYTLKANATGALPPPPESTPAPAPLYDTGHGIFTGQRNLAIYNAETKKRAAPALGEAKLSEEKPYETFKTDEEIRKQIELSKRMYGWLTEIGTDPDTATMISAKAPQLLQPLPVRQMTGPQVLSLGIEETRGNPGGKEIKVSSDPNSVYDVRERRMGGIVSVLPGVHTTQAGALTPDASSPTGVSQPRIGISGTPVTQNPALGPTAELDYAGFLKDPVLTAKYGATRPGYDRWKSDIQQTRQINVLQAGENIRYPGGSPDKIQYIADQLALDASPSTRAVLIGSDRKLERQVVDELARRGTTIDALTAQTKQLAQAGKEILPQFDAVIRRINTPEMQDKLGPIMGRWNEFEAGRIGSGDPDFTRLRSTVDLLKTGTMRAHFGARGGQGILDRFDGLADAGRMDPATLTAALEGMRDFIRETYVIPRYGTATPNEGGVNLGHTKPPATTNTTPLNPPPTTPETKTIKGVVYEKVTGGWRRKQ